MLTATESIAPELAGAWDIDVAHSGVEFSVRHAMVATVRGRFNDFAEASTTISRKDWGLTWNAALEAGGVLVGDKVRITLGISAVKRAV